jgi:hypothetical protein
MTYSFSFIIAEVKVSNIGRVDRPVFYWKIRLNLNEFYFIWAYQYFGRMLYALK